MLLPRKSDRPRVSQVIYMRRGQGGKVAELSCKPRKNIGKSTVGIDTGTHGTDSYKARRTQKQKLGIEK